MPKLGGTTVNALIIAQLNTKTAGPPGNSLENFNILFYILTGLAVIIQIPK